LALSARCPSLDETKRALLRSTARAGISSAQCLDESRIDSMLHDICGIHILQASGLLAERQLDRELQTTMNWPFEAKQQNTCLRTSAGLNG